MEPKRPESASPAPVRHATWIALALAAAYVLLHAPSLADFSRWHGDERFYVDAAVRMRAAGDWTVAVYPDGRPRFAKPLLLYWILGASHGALGIGLASSRLPSLLAGAALVLLAFASARRLFADDAVALACAALVFANAQLAALATRATPDIFVCLGTGICLHGVARALGRGRAAPGDATLLWGGAGLSVAAKGGLGLVAPAFALALLALRRDPALRARDLARGPALVLGAALAIAGVGAPVLRHGSAAIAGLLQDQVGSRVEASRGLVPPLRNALVMLRSTLKNLAPFSLLVALAWALAAGPLREVVRRTRAAHALGLAWWALLAVIFSAGSDQRGRYLAPATLLLCALCALHLVTALRAERGARALQALCAALAGAVGIAGLGVLAAALRLGGAAGGELAGAGVLLAGASGLALWQLARGEREVALFAAAVALGVGIAGIDTGVRPAFDATPVPALAARLEALGAGSEAVATLGGSHSLAAKLRIASGARLDPVSLDAGTPLEALAPFAVVVAPPEEAKRLADAGWRTEAVGFEYATWRARDLRALLAAADPEAVLAGRREWSVLATPPDR